MAETSLVNTEIDGRPALLDHSTDADAISWSWSPTVGVRLTSNRFDYRVNCDELLAIARSVSAYSPHERDNAEAAGQTIR